MKSSVILFAVLLSYTGFAQTNQASSYWGVSIFYDQDYTLEQLGLKSLNEDRNYTMGLGISLTLPGLKQSFLMFPHYAINSILGKNIFNDKSNSHPEIINSIMFANGTFTPDDLTIYDVIRNDRPYGSLTYLQTMIVVVDPIAHRQYTSTFSAGIIGSFISREVQTAIHKSMNDGDTHAPRTPRGWSNQISNGGEPTLGYTYEEQRLLVGKASADAGRYNRFGLELKHGWKYSIGYYTMADYELNFRFGKINPERWAYLVNPLGSSSNIVAARALQPATALNPHSDVNGTKNKFELYTFGSLRPTFMLYNALLNGQFKKSVYTLDFQDMRHLIYEFDGGVALSATFGGKNMAEIKLMISGRSPEFELPGRDPRWHYWGGLHLNFSRIP